MKRDSKIYIAGHQGMVGSSIHRLLQAKGFINILVRTSKELDLRNQAAVLDFFAQEQPEYVFLAAAKVGGIHANSTFPAIFLYDNIMIEFNVIHSAYLYNVKKLLFLGSSAIYPQEAVKPVIEESLLSGYLTEENKSYALAKIAGIQLCKDYNRQYGVDFISIVPTNLYGYEDNFDNENSHVLPALINRIHNAKVENLDEIVVWGSGEQFREFMFSDDLADACLFLMKNYSGKNHLNIGSGEEISIKDLVTMICEVIGFEGTIVFDKNKPEGIKRNLLDSDKIKSLGWNNKTSLREGIIKTYDWYLSKITGFIKE